MRAALCSALPFGFAPISASLVIAQDKSISFGETDCACADTASRAHPASIAVIVRNNRTISPPQEVALAQRITIVTLVLRVRALINSRVQRTMRHCIGPTGNIDLTETPVAQPRDRPRHGALPCRDHRPSGD